MAKSQRAGIIRQFAACFRDHRDPDLIEHRVEELIAQRVYGLCLGYEDLNDHDRLRRDPMLAVMVGKDDPLGEERCRARDNMPTSSVGSSLSIPTARATMSSRAR